MMNEARVTLSIGSYNLASTSKLSQREPAYPINFPYLMPNAKDIPNGISTVSVPNLPIDRRISAVALDGNHLDGLGYSVVLDRTGIHRTVDG